MMLIAPDIAQQIRRIAATMDLSDEEVLRRALRMPPTRASTPATHGAGHLMPLITAGTLRPGHPLTWIRRNLGTHHAATVTPDGWIELDSGQRFKSPSAAANAAAGGSHNGWMVWRTQDGTPLGDLRE